MGHEEEEKRTLKKTQRMKSQSAIKISKRKQNFSRNVVLPSSPFSFSITLALSLLARRLSSSSPPPATALS